ncbi:MAG: EAL domain-containing protein [Acidimicrobiales bacterium]|jgi:diguanylate cyclase (GGDEF)-like protein/PAS domain S-box-containing protein
MALPGRDARGFWRTAGFLALLTGLYVLWVALRIGGSRTTDIFDNLGELIAPLAAAASCGVASWRLPQARLSWALLAASCASWAAGQAVWCEYDVVRDLTVPFPSLADAGYLSAVPLFIGGLLTFPSVARRLASRLRSLLDAAMITGSLLFASWALVLGPTFRDAKDGLFKEVLSMAYPASDVAMVSLAVIVAISAEKDYRACLGLVMAGIIAFAVADSGFAYFTATNSYGIGNALDGGWVAGYFVIGLGALSAMRAAPAGLEDIDSDRVNLTSVLTPYAIVGLAGVVVMARLAERQSFGLFLPVEGFLLLVTLTARQILTLLDNVALNKRLVVKVQRGSEELREREERFAALGQHSSDAITIVDTTGTIMFQSPSVERVLGWKAEATAGGCLLDMIKPSDRELWPNLVARLLSDPTAEVTVEWRMRHSDGSWRSLQSVLTNLLNEPSVAGLVLNSRDVTVRKALEEQLRHQAFHDPLTGLANRALFSEHLNNSVHRRRRSGVALGVMFIDLHNFKAVNDLHGHARGDQVLKEVGDRLKTEVRDADVIARLGGDEFAVLLEGPKDEFDPDAVAGRLAESFVRPFGEGDNRLVVQVNIGVAVSGDNAESVSELLRDADLAINAAKAAGAGSYVRFTSALHQQILDRMQIESELRLAVERNELRVHYQPVVKLSSGEIEGVEALIRWAHPVQGMVPPGRFIAVAESSGLIVKIGEWVLRQACGDLQAMTRIAGRPLRMSVNVSARQLSHPGFEDMVLSALRHANADPAQITLEITESQLIDDMAGKADLLARLRQHGLKIAIDDFGTGYSSLSSLRDMPIDTLKIDKSFIDGIALSRDSARLTQTVIHLAVDLGLGIVAEGAEKLEQVEVLRSLGCDLVQGYFFSRPVPVAELERLLREGIGVTTSVAK